MLQYEELLADMLCDTFGGKKATNAVCLDDACNNMSELS